MVCLTQFLIRLDGSLFERVNSLAGNSAVVDFLARLGADDHVIPVILALLLATVVVVARNRRGRQSAFCCVICALFAAAAAMAVLYLLNVHIFRPRPFSSRAVNLLFYHNTDSGFPSNPATLVFSVSFAVFFYRRKLGAVMLALSLGMSLGRIVVGVHYPLDILGGLLLGLACALLAKAAEPLYRPVCRWLTSTLYRLLATWRPPVLRGGGR
jgi:undecaprenyl-diphosphatase